MCGVAGIYDRSGGPVPLELLRRMSDAIAHRGPDGEGQYADGPVGLANRRLAIIDPNPAGDQPMVDLSAYAGRPVLITGGLGFIGSNLARALVDLGAKVLGHGAGYEYPHDHDGGWVAQQYLPDELADRRWYRPSEHGHEQEIARRMDEHES